MPGESAMNPNYIHTITLYNKIKAEDTEDKKERWVRTVIQNCFFKSEIKTTFSGTQANASNTYVARIPQDAKYLPYPEFVKSPKGHFTVSNDDIVIRGECCEEITGKSGNTAVQVLSRHKPDAFKVTAFSDNTFHRMGKHYRLGG